MVRCSHFLKNQLQPFSRLEAPEIFQKNCQMQLFSIWPFPLVSSSHFPGGHLQPFFRLSAPAIFLVVSSSYLSQVVSSSRFQVATLRMLHMGKEGHSWVLVLYNSNLRKLLGNRTTELTAKQFFFLENKSLLFRC